MLCAYDELAPIKLKEVQQQSRMMEPKQGQSVSVFRMRATLNCSWSVAGLALICSKS
jgi:hypothetical protein